jgi:hypothetical protein
LISRTAMGQARGTAAAVVCCWVGPQCRMILGCVAGRQHASVVVLGHYLALSLSNLFSVMPVASTAQGQDDPVTPPGTGFPFRRLLDSQEYGGCVLSRFAQ